MNSKESELVLNADGSVYHLHLKNEHIADNVILVGDPSRVQMVAAHLDQREFEISNREFSTVTGWFGDTRFTALSTGIGTDNIDIVVNELDAAVNIDPRTRTLNSELRQLNLVRLGTCGSLRAEADAGAVVQSSFALGADGVKHFYNIEQTEEEHSLEKAFVETVAWPKRFNQPYAIEASLTLPSLDGDVVKGITLTANGFFGPQGRAVRLPLADPGLNDRLAKFEHQGNKLINYEMECSALYALGRALGHRCLTQCVVVANRATGNFPVDYKKDVDRMIAMTLKALSSE